MNNKPSVRTQVDDLQDTYSTMTALDCSAPMENGQPNVDRARQDGKADADINRILTRFGVQTPTRGLGQFGTEVDYNIDLQQALHSIAEAKHAHRNLPENLRRKYPTWQQLVTALDSGALRLLPEDPTPPIVTPPKPEA